MRYTAADIKALIAEDDEFIINLLADFDSDYRTSGDALVFRTVCHGGTKYKLYYYPESQMFHCYTDCSDSFDVIELVQRVKHCDFKDALNFLGERLGLDMDYRNGIGIGSREIPEEIPSEPAKPFDIAEYERPEVSYYDAENLLNYFVDEYYQGWIDEGISTEVMKAFEIKYYYLESQIVIPCRDYNGKLAGFRVRELKEDATAKYRPLYLEGKNYKFESSNILYGLYQNLDAIKKYKKCVLFEGEKSVLKARTMYGANAACAAVFGHNVFIPQIKLLYDLGVEEIILAFDYDGKGSEYSGLLSSIHTLHDCNMNFSIMLDGYQELLEPHDAPIDKGKDVFETLLKKRCNNIAQQVFEDSEHLEDDIKSFLDENHARAVERYSGYEKHYKKDGFTTIVYTVE